MSDECQIYTTDDTTTFLVFGGIVGNACNVKSARLTFPDGREYQYRNSSSHDTRAVSASRRGTCPAGNPDQYSVAGKLWPSLTAKKNDLPPTGTRPVTSRVATSIVTSALSAEATA